MKKLIVTLATAILLALAVHSEGIKIYSPTEATEKTRRTKNGMIVEKKIPVGKVVRF